MITIELTGEQLRSAMHCIAKNEIRCYLNNFLIDIENSKIVGSNGHIAFISDVKITGDTAIKKLIIEPIKVGKTIDTVFIDYEENTDSVIIRLINKKQRVINQRSGITDTNYPDVLKHFSKEKVANDTFLFNASYLSAIESVYGKNTVVKVNAVDVGMFLVEKHCIDDTNSKLLILPLLK